MPLVSERVQEKMIDRRHAVADFFDAGISYGTVPGKFLQWGGTAAALTAGAVYMWNFKTPMPGAEWLQNFGNVSHDLTPNQAVVALDGLVTALGTGIAIPFVWAGGMMDDGDNRLNAFGCLGLTALAPLLAQGGLAALPVYVARKTMQGIAIGAVAAVNGAETLGRVLIGKTGKEKARR